MAYRTLYFILLSCLVLCCTNKSSKNEVANLDSVQTARLVVKSIDVPNEETTHAYYDTARVPIKYLSEENKETDIYLVVEVMPEFPNGLKALFDFIYDNLKYPSDAIEKGIQGRVTVGVVIDENGSVTQPKILKSISSSLDKEALRIVSIMPKWKPGTQDGVPVKVKCTFPVIFKLPNNDDLKTDSLIKSTEE